ncbi:hypothetical protein [Lentzea cavernae]|uniref:DUF58 domain-containing protein n=1 Tax=Lentzea cavernae TaxID=2020703 RepID=A0ABQ3MN21_9PSEU|nr:hypothetical protein [Lentzea cavernae]GHH51757.1 hypothetical protein GCM10017774_62740 [Lentzea cavernae]
MSGETPDGPQDTIGAAKVVRPRLSSGVQTAVILVVGVPTAVLLGVIPIVVLASDGDTATKMSVVQAAASWWTAVAALIAVAVALVAYRNSLQRPDLVLVASNSLSVIKLRLTNTGNASALRPVVRLRVGNEGVFHREGLNQGWAHEEFGQDGYFGALTWYGVGTVIYPGFTLDLPPLTLDESADLRAVRNWPVTATWICEGGQRKEQHFGFTLPSAR